MSQEQLILLLLKIGLISGFSSIVAWVTVYSVLSKGRNWKSPIGRSLMRFAILVAALLVPFTLSLFFSLTRLDSRIVAWYDVVMIGAVSAEMATRIIVFARIGPAPRGARAGELHDDTVPAPLAEPGVSTDGTV